MHKFSNLHIVLFGFIDETESIIKAIKQNSNHYISQCSGLESLARLLEEHCDFDILILQLSYKEKNLDEIFDFISKQEDLPILIISNSNVKKHAFDAFEMGIEDYIHVSEINPPSLNRSIYFAIKRKEYKKQIHNSESNYKTLFYSSPLPMWVLDRYTLKFLSVNQAAIDHYGYSEEEFLKMKASDLWIKEEEEKIKLMVKEFTNDFLHETVCHVKKDGSVMTINFHSTPIFYDGREARLTLARDVTENLKIRKALKDSEMRFKSLVQEGSDLIGILDSDFNYKYISPSVESILSLQPKQLRKKHFFDRVHPEDQEFIKALFLSITNTKNSKIGLPFYRVKDGNGYWRFLETKLTNLLDFSPIQGIVINSRDVTDLVEQRNRLSESLGRYEIVSEATSDIVTDYDFKTGKVKISKSIFKVCGHDPKVVEQEDFEDWWMSHVHEKDRKEIRNKVLNVIESGNKSFQLEYRFKCADGSYKTLLDRSYLVTDRDGKPEKIIGSKQDITQQKDQLKQIKSRNKILEEIAWQQSHMVRAPLAKIMGLIDLLKYSENNHEETKDLLEKILNSAEDLDAVIRNIAEKTYN
ncbi:PAS domain S-box protein [Zunongwangia atlantica]|uniref:histidine kinase n=1 Tax=Zunongwangia atlantica 22II14-10F7 TaxID=1185767 RepID=A0A1Y1T8Z2_9FLAO|nr:PAS domain S-box protein [Zunongwangia atlantica]ORL46873.1 PAS domain-containing protein [Zunongwangia atlantica 22II14-10F7]